MVMAPLGQGDRGKAHPVVTNAGGVNPQACRDALAAVLGEAGVESEDRRRRPATTCRTRSSSYRRRRRARDVLRRAAARAACQRERLSRRVPDRGGARCRRRHRDHRALRRFRRRARPADARIRLEAERLRQARGRQPCRPCRSNAARRRPAASSPTGATCRGWDDMGFPIAECRADGSFEHDQASRHRRPGQPRPRSASRWSTRSATRQPTCCPTSSATGADVKMEQAGEDRVRVSGARGRAPTLDLQGQRDLSPTAIALPSP